MRDTGIKFFFDGGCKPNPGAMTATVVSRGVAYPSPPLGDGSSGDAEWLALLHALRVAADLGAQDIILIGDSRMVIDHAAGKAPPARAFRHHYEAYRVAASSFVRVRLRHVARSHNLAGIALDAA